jgi:hypothetical protein
VHPVDPAHRKVIQKLHNSLVIGIERIRVPYNFQQSNLVSRRLCVMLRGLDHLEGDIALTLNVPAQPDGGKVTPAEFSNHPVPVVEDIAEFDRMVAAATVLRDVLLLLVFRSVQTRIGTVRKLKFILRDGGTARLGTASS